MNGQVIFSGVVDSNNFDNKLAVSTFDIYEFTGGENKVIVYLCE
ncbi:hypothetical protein VB713_23395 [Anabaena cylindrica UHCC 0172]|nr:hypothetical protein [Anabaena cylindrica UHCC 0172]